VLALLYILTFDTINNFLSCSHPPPEFSPLAQNTDFLSSSRGIPTNTTCASEYPSPRWAGGLLNHMNSAPPFLLFPRLLTQCVASSFSSVIHCRGESPAVHLFADFSPPPSPGRFEFFRFSIAKFYCMKRLKSADSFQPQHAVDCDAVTIFRSLPLLSILHLFFGFPPPLQPSQSPTVPLFWRQTECSPRYLIPPFSPPQSATLLLLPSSDDPVGPPILHPF